MPYTSDGAPPYTLITTKVNELVPGLNDEQRLNIAILVARDGLTFAQAAAVAAPKAPAAVLAAHQPGITRIVSTKNAAHPFDMRLVR